MSDSHISWKAKKQTTMSRPKLSTEPLLLLLVISQLLSELPVPLTSSALISYDNDVALYIATNPVSHERMEHFELDCHFVRDRIVK